MAKNPDVDVNVPVLYVRWKVSVPSLDIKSKQSCLVIFQDQKWRLNYHFSGSQHSMGFYSNDPASQVRYSIILHVEDSDKKILPALSSDLLHFDGVVGTFFWEKLHSEVEQAYPGFRNKQQMNFLVVVKADDFLTDDSSACPLCKSVITNKLPCLESLSEDLSKLLDHQDHAHHDVEFQCAGHSVKAHQAVVSARSRVMASMLTSEMVEGRTKVVRIPDMKLEIFKQFLAYLYSGSLEELSFEAAFDLYEAGDQYAVHGLAKKCSKFLMEQLSVDNACKLLVVADARSDDKFKEAVVSFMLEHKIPLSDCWQDFCKNHPMLAIMVLNQSYQKVST